MSFRHQLLKLKLVRFFSSIKLTVTCLFLLYLLTLGGTIAQIQDGLYLAQQRYFESLFFLMFGFLPFPGAQAVMWVLFFNLTCVALTRFVYQWNRIGIIIIHSGLMFFLVSSFVIFHNAEESHLTLAEGQASNVSVSYHDWEISIWETEGNDDTLSINRDIIAIDSNHFKPGQNVSVDPLGLQLTVNEYHKNCEAYTSKENNSLMNVSGIGRLEPKEFSTEPSRNVPGGIFTVRSPGAQTSKILLYGGESKPTIISVGSKKYSLMLRFKRYPLPFILRLKDFKKEEHPGTELARSFQSLVEVQVNNAWREKLISMNEPLRHNEFTFYQASYSVDKNGQEISTLAVVKNVGQWMPYIATFITVLGLAIHFIMMALSSNPKRKT